MPGLKTAVATCGSVQAKTNQKVSPAMAVHVTSMPHGPLGSPGFDRPEIVLARTIAGVPRPRVQCVFVEAFWLSWGIPFFL